MGKGNALPPLGHSVRFLKIPSPSLWEKRFGSLTQHDELDSLVVTLFTELFSCRGKIKKKKGEFRKISLN